LSSFYFYNIKVLPISGSRSELIGKEGYKKLFDQFWISIRTAHRTRRLLDVSFALRNDFYFSVLHITNDIPYAHGKFLKFDQPSALVDTLTGDPIQTVPKNASAHRHEFEFLFNYTHHILAVQHISGKSPGTTKLIEAIKYLLTPTQSEFFPKHYLEISLITSDVELDKVLEDAKKIKRVDVSLTITNSDEYLDDEISETEQELAAMKIAYVRHEEKGPENGFMDGITKKCRAFLMIAKKNGDATIRYLSSKHGKLQTYVMNDFPLKIRVSWTKRTAESVYKDAIHDATIQANNRATK
jgi:hypothetical protein